MVPEVFRSGVGLAITVLEELTPPRDTDRDSALCGSPVEVGHVCRCGAFYSLFSLSEAQELIGLVLVFWRLDLHQATHIYDLCGGMISYMQVMFYIHVMIPAYGFIY